MDALMPQPPELPDPTRKRKAGAPDDRLIIVLLIVVGAFPIVLGFVRSEGWTAPATGGMLMVAFALKQLVDHWRRDVRARRRTAEGRHERRSRSED